MGFTIHAETGGLAGLLYGFKTIPTKGLKKLSRKEDIEDLAERLNENLNNPLTLIKIT